MKKIAFFFILCYPVLLAAQDYRNIITPGITYYVDSVSYLLKPVRIDSIQLPGNGDTVFYAFNTIRPIAGSDSADTVGGVLGRKIVKKTDGWFWFFNRAGDTLFLQSQAQINDSWRFCRLGDSGYISVTCINKGTGSVLGTTDAVKVFSFQAKNNSGGNIPNYFNGETIILSQHYGLIRTFDLIQFPFNGRKLTLAGKTDPALGFQAITPAGIFDFQPGDEFEYDGTTYSFQGYNQVTDLSMRRMVIKSRTDHPEQHTVEYSADVCKRVFNSGVMPYQPPSYHYTYDTAVPLIFSTDTASNPVGFATLPEAFTGITTGFFSTIPDDFPGVPSKGWIGQQYNCCWTFGPSYLQTDRTTYSLGLGKTYEMTLVFSPLNEPFANYESLHYYKKGSVEKGLKIFEDCSAMQPYLVTNPDTVFLDAPAGSSNTLHISTNIEWDLNTDPIPAWLSIYPMTGGGNGDVTITANSALTGNETRISRLAVQLTYYPLYHYFFVMQKKPMSVASKTIAQVEVRPNPFSDKAWICSPYSGEMELTLSDLAGRVVMEKHVTAMPAEISKGSLPAGIYFLKLTRGASDTPGVTRVVIE
jgi:hypothetical protein